MSVEPCLACGSPTVVIERGVWDTRFGIETTFDVARCSACGLEQTTPRPTGPELARWYAGYYNFGGERGTAYTKLRRLVFEGGLFRLWSRIDGDISFYFRPAPPGARRLLDVGCNEGRGLAFYARTFAVAEGLETNPVAAATARARGHVVHEAETADFRPDAPYDVAVLSNVLEHALDPAAMLRDVARLLRPGGEIWISCPNSRSWLRRLTGRRWINWHVPFHIVHFDAETLSACIARAGLAAAPPRLATPALWVAHSMIAWAFARPGRPTRALRNPLLVMALMLTARGLLFPLLWALDRRGRGDCLIAIARVPEREGA